MKNDEITVAEASRLSKVDRYAIYALIFAGVLPSRKVANLYLIPRSVGLEKLREFAANKQKMMAENVA